MKNLKEKLHVIIVVNLDTQQTFAKVRKVCKILNLSLLVTILIARNKDTKHMNAGQRQMMHLLHLDLKGIVINVINMDINLMNVDPKKNLIGHLKGKHMHLNKVTLPIGITTHGIIFIIVESMGTFQRIVLRHISEEITRND